RISAQFFDKNYIFDNRASIHIKVTNAETATETTFPMLLRHNFYEVDLSNLEAGEYSYTVSASDGAIARSGSFTILDFNVEQQFLNADIAKLHRVAENTDGKEYFITQGDLLIESLLTN